MCHTLRSWLQENVNNKNDFVPWIGRKHYIDIVFEFFPGTTRMLDCLENCHIYISMSHYSPIQGTRCKMYKTWGLICPVLLTRNMFLSPKLENNNTSKCISNSCPGVLTYVLFLEYFCNYI